MFYYKGVLNEVADLKPAILLNKRFRRKCFSVKFGKFLRTDFYRTPVVAASVFLFSFYDKRKQSIPNPCKYVKL